jgi:hypothetical protein
MDYTSSQIKVEGISRALGQKNKGCAAAKTCDFEPDIKLIDDEQITTLYETSCRKQAKEDPTIAHLNEIDYEAKRLQV